MKILIVGPSWIGDTLLAQPLFALLHERYPQCELDVLAPQWTRPLLARMPEVSGTLANPFAHGELNLRARRALGRTLREAHYDRAYVLPNTYKSALVPYFAGIPVRTGYRGELRWGILNDVRQLDPAAVPMLTQRYAALALAPAERLPAMLPQLRLRVDDASRLATLAKLGLDDAKNAVALCPGAEYGPAKRWPVEHYAVLARTIAQAGRPVWIVGSAKDAPVGAEIAALADAGCANLCGRTSLDEVVEVLASASAVVSNDSGLMHVAAALEKPLVALYGSSSPAYTPPLSAAATIVKLDLPCSPCFRRVCPLGHFNCMRQLTPQLVEGALGQLPTGVPAGAQVAKLVREAR
jgi:heptosyltransferase II